jgi:hypothetical protein
MEGAKHNKFISMLGTVLFVFCKKKQIYIFVTMPISQYLDFPYKADYTFLKDYEVHSVMQE